MWSFCREYRSELKWNCRRGNGRKFLADSVLSGGPMRNKKVGLTILWCLIAFCMAGCGGSSGPTALVVTLSPPSASIAVNSSVQISLQNPALPKYTSSVNWSIQEYGSSTSCIEVATGLPSDAPPIPNCPFGWLALANPQTGYSSIIRVVTLRRARPQPHMWWRR